MLRLCSSLVKDEGYLLTLAMCEISGQKSLKMKREKKSEEKSAVSRLAAHNSFLLRSYFYSTHIFIQESDTPSSHSCFPFIRFNPQRKVVTIQRWTRKVCRSVNHMKIRDFSNIVGLTGT